MSSRRWAGGGRQWGGEAGPETRGEGGMGWTHRALGGSLPPGFAEPEAPRGEGGESTSALGEPETIRWPCQPSSPPSPGEMRPR